MRGGKGKKPQIYVRLSFFALQTFQLLQLIRLERANKRYLSILPLSESWRPINLHLIDTCDRFLRCQSNLSLTANIACPFAASDRIGCSTSTGKNEINIKREECKWWINLCSRQSLFVNEKSIKSHNYDGDLQIRVFRIQTFASLSISVLSFRPWARCGKISEARSHRDESQRLHRNSNEAFLTNHLFYSASDLVDRIISGAGTGDPRRRN